MAVYEDREIEKKILSGCVFIMKKIDDIDQILTITSGSMDMCLDM